MVKNLCIGVVEGQVFFEGMDCISMALNCALELGSWGVLGEMVVSVVLVGGIAIFFRGRRVYFAQDYMCHVVKNLGDCGICSVSEELWRYFAAMKLCGESVCWCKPRQSLLCLPGPSWARSKPFASISTQLA